MEAELGRTHATTLITRNNAALMLMLSGDPRAETAFRRLLEAQRERYGEHDAEIAATLQNLAVAVKTAERYDEAERLSLSAHAMFSTTKGPAHFQTAYPLLTVSEIRMTVGDFVGAEAVSRQALGLLQAALPAGHFATAVAECRLGEALLRQGRSVEARLFWRPASPR